MASECENVDMSVTFPVFYFLAASRGHVDNKPASEIFEPIVRYKNKELLQ